MLESLSKWAMVGFMKKYFSGFEVVCIGEVEDGLHGVRLH